MVASILLALAILLYPAPAAAFEPPPDRPYASPRYFFVEDAEPPMRLRDQHGREIDLAATGWKRSGYGYEVWIPRLIPGVYTLSWEGGSLPFEVDGGPYALPLPEDAPPVAGGPPGRRGALVASALLLAAGAAAVIGRRRALGATLIVSGLAAGSLLYVLGSPSQPAADPCAAETNHSIRIRCMTGYLSAAMASGGPEEAVSELMRLASGPSSAWRPECHELLHSIGEVSWQLFPDVTRLAAAGTVDCTFGFFHGMLEAMGSYSSDAELAELLAGTCQTIYAHHGSAASVRNGCSHGAGHAAMWRSGADLTLARSFCSGFEDPRDGDECVSGAVMEWAAATRRSADSGDQTHRPAPYVDDPFDLCYPPHGEPTSGCFGGAILAVERHEVVEKVARCLGAGLEVEEACRSYALVSLRNLHPEGYEDFSAAVARLCVSIPWESGPGQCYRNVGYLIMVSTMSLQEVEAACSFAPREELFEACVSGADDAEAVLLGGGSERRD